MPRLQPEDRALSTALRRIVADELFPGDRAQRVLVVAKTTQGYEVHTRMAPREVRTGVHLPRLRELRESEAEIVAIIHINLKGLNNSALVHVLDDGENVYRIRPQKPPRPPRWLTVTDRQRERWDEVWGSL